MNIQVLKELLKKHATARNNRLYEALEDPSSTLFSDRVDDISFSAFTRFMTQNELEFSLPEKREAFSDTDLFHFVITGKVPQEEQKESLRAFDDITSNDILNRILQPMCDVKTNALLSSCSQAFYKRTTSNTSYWRERLRTLHINEEVSKPLFDKRIELNLNFAKLCHSLSHISVFDRVHIETWELCCLSGNLQAIEYASQINNLTRTVGEGGRNALHYAAQSGSVAAMRYVVEVLQIAPSDIDRYVGNDALHYAAQSGSVAAMRYVVEVLQIAPKSNKGGDNTLLLAAASGSVAAMRYSVEELKTPPDSTNQFGENALLFAAESGSVAKMRYAVEVLKISPTSTNKHGENALLLAARSETDSVDAMRYSVEELKIYPTSTNKHGENALLLAAASGSVAAMCYAVEVLKISPTSTNKHGQNALLHAATSGSVAAMCYAVEVLKISPTSTNKHGENALLHAATSGSVAAMRYAVEVLKISPTSTNKHGQNALHLTLWADVARYLRCLSFRLRLNLETMKDDEGVDPCELAKASHGYRNKLVPILKAPIEDLFRENGDVVNQNDTYQSVANQAGH